MVNRKIEDIHENNNIGGGHENVLNFLNDGFYGSVEKYISYQKKSTGFDLLDKYLNGLMPGLYLFGAVSSIGKTTYMIQVADNIARNGNDVLYFSLEQSKFELICKSLSRTAYVELKEKVTAKEVMYNIDSELTERSMELYKDTAKRLFIIEGNFDTSIEEIKDSIEKHIAITGNKPVVIIDYLQVIGSNSPGKSDKMIIDNMVTTLKRISRDLFIPIFVISSLNRANYLNPISYESFKESGSIEYTADVLIGLQYAAINGIQDIKPASNQRAVIKTAIEGDKIDNYRRDIELVALKNRNGKQQFNIRYSFYPCQNYFKERPI